MISPPTKITQPKKSEATIHAHRGNMRSSENCITMRQRSDPYHVAGDQVSSPWKVPQLWVPTLQGEGKPQQGPLKQKQPPHGFPPRNTK